jgi:small GTP-binding protein
MAHVDHGKSSLSAALIGHYYGSKYNEISLLDNLKVEQQRGITVRLQVVSLSEKINLIDTPGHVDFQAEVSKGIDLMNSVLLVVSAKDGVQVQTRRYFDNLQKKKRDFHLIVVLTKMDLANQEETIESFSSVRKLLKDIIIFSLRCTSKNSPKCIERLANLLEDLPLSKMDDTAYIVLFQKDKHANALLIKNGAKSIGKNDTLYYGREAENFKVRSIYKSTFKKETVDRLYPDDIGYLIINKQIDVDYGQIINHKPLASRETKFGRQVSPTYQRAFFTHEKQHRELLSYLKSITNDGHTSCKECTHSLFGRGVLCYFMGILHSEIVNKRITDEVNLKVISTPPETQYRIILKNGEVLNDFNEVMNVKDID